MCRSGVIGGISDAICERVLHDMNAKVYGIFTAVNVVYRREGNIGAYIIISPVFVGFHFYGTYFAEDAVISSVRAIERAK